MNALRVNPPNNKALPPESPDRAAIVAVVGRANVGKSTLVNALVGEKVSIVSPVAQTTRNCIRGVWSEARGQLVFLDTPGVHRAGHDLGRLMNRVARNSAAGADLVLLVLDATASPRIEDEGWMRKLAVPEMPPRILALNKTDAITPRSDQRSAHRALWNRLQPPAAAGSAARPATGPDCTWVELSAKTGAGVAALRDRLLDLAPAGPRLFPDDLLSDFPRKLMIADLVREKLFHTLQAELPYAVAVRIALLRETEAGWTAEGDILVNKISQKGIVIGARGRRLKGVLLDAERELTDLYERPVRLRLRVRVHRDWAADPAMLRQLGYLP